ncbi:hypothetical protein [Senegalia massiliensis]|uniref:hypothetical protein n=1 Tax=Senegalia massiliensis TaxID=1720316 RepID=UPI00103261EB|nr:hypothetical protein [Senegalia massiliensis]
MRKYMIAEADIHSTALRQLGAEIHVMNSLLCYVSFNVKGTKVSYVYNINKKNKYFLQRIKPYPETAGTFSSEDELIKTIKIDIEQFENAANSHHFKEFIEFNKNLNETIRNFEDLYLYYNVPNETVKEIQVELNKMQALIKRTKETSQRVYKKKDPDTI